MYFSRKQAFWGRFFWTELIYFYIKNSTNRISRIENEEIDNYLIDNWWRLSPRI